MTWRDLTEVARRQRGVVSVRQAVALGIPRSTLLAHAERFGLERPTRGVVLLAGADPADPRTASWIELCRTGAPAWIGGHQALALVGVVRRPPIVDVVVPRDRRPRDRYGVRFRRLDLGPDEVTRQDGVPVVSTPVALRMAAATETHRETLAAVAAAVQLRAATLDDVATAAAGRARGSARLRTAVEQLRGSGAHSVLAHEVTVLLRQAGYRVDAEVSLRRADARRAQVDLLITGTDVVVEADGDVAHAAPRQQSRDRHRRNALVAAGYRVLRVDWRRLLGDPDGFLREVRLTVGAPRRS